MLDCHKAFHKRIVPVRENRSARFQGKKQTPGTHKGLVVHGVWWERRNKSKQNVRKSGFTADPAQERVGCHLSEERA
jgi:hypothetical protein